MQPLISSSSCGRWDSVLIVLTIPNRVVCAAEGYELQAWKTVPAHPFASRRVCKLLGFCQSTYLAGIQCRWQVAVGLLAYQTNFTGQVSAIFLVMIFHQAFSRGLVYFGADMHSASPLIVCSKSAEEVITTQPSADRQLASWLPQSAPWFHIG